MINTTWLRNISLTWFLQMSCRWMVKRFKFFNRWHHKHKSRYVIVCSIYWSEHQQLYFFSWYQQCPHSFSLFYIYSCGEKITYLILLLLATIQSELIISIQCPSGMLKCLDSPIGERIPLMGNGLKVLLLFTLQMESEPVPSTASLVTRISTLVLVTTAALLGEKKTLF